MRIIGGRLKGRRIEPPRGITARPTTDFTKEALFNILQHSIPLEDIRVLDLFAGAGGISLEFLSRGAEQVISVELDNVLHAYLRRNAAALNLANWHCVKSDAFAFLRAQHGNFDVIFADPPFNLPGTSDLPALVRERQLLGTNGLLIVEHPRDIDFGTDPWFDSCRKYSNIHFSFFTPKPGTP
ncbi:MAG: 16S rRNA (guanine(966)-N(2))-methyltransferase RsmD [Bacteroidetes bacterium]|nr:16S rRNA (guanine(966)-N(2))-methyltransferase RsmD [Bacteroidota bacterium]MBS1941009.1 16S rRNA (guanine(966)-N(2))-methyltransferase RsmD [Bacteroidota bacterium]